MKSPRISRRLAKAVKAVTMDRHAAQRSSAEASWGTPRVVVDLARAVLGRIDLDPFSSAEWNQTVKATRYIDASQNAFGVDWSECADKRNDCTALVNPPGDRRGNSVKRAWEITEAHHRTGLLGGGVIWVAFNLSQFRTLQRAGSQRSPLFHGYLRCVPAMRLAYESSPGVQSKAPAHATAIVLLPSNGRENSYQRDIFRDLCAGLGDVF